MPTDYDDWRKIEEAEVAERPSRQPAREVRPASTIGCRRSAADCRACAYREPAIYLAAALAPAATDCRSQAGSGRGVAQPGRALSSGGRGRRFESSLPDQHLSPSALG